MTMKVGTYNIAKPVPTTGLADWEERCDNVIQNIRNASLDVICLQEISTTNKDWVISQLQDEFEFTTKFCGEKSGVALGYRKSRFQVINETSGVFVRGDRKRGYAQYDLQDNTTLKITRFASMHLYGGDPQLGKAQLNTFRAQIERESENIDQIILAGDFNSDIDQESEEGVCHSLVNKSSRSDYIYRTLTESILGKIVTNKKGDRQLDWIFVGVKYTGDRKAVPVIKHKIVPLIHGASDHTMNVMKISSELVEIVYAKTIPVAVSPAVIQALTLLFSSNTRITRKDLVDAAICTRENSNELTKRWINEGLLIQNDSGKKLLPTLEEINFLHR